MAIIYNYPLNSILLAEDMLIGTSTKIVNGQPKNATKNFSIADLTGFIKQNVSLDDVLLVGNTSLLDAKIGKLYLYDTPVADYGNIALNQNRFSFSTVTHGEVFRAQRDMFSSFSSSGYRGSFEVSNITANRVWDFPDKSGTVALLSDMSSAEWGSITGDIEDQTDLINYISSQITTPTLQQVLDNNHNLINGNNFQGTTAGLGATGFNINAFGTNAALNNNGSSLNALGNTSGNNNSGDNVNAFGDSAGNGNTFSHVNLLGQSASSDENGQTVLSKDGTIMARISTTDLTDTRKYNLPNASGTIALTTDIPAAQVNSDWNSTSGVSEILNKPTIPAAQVNSDWNATSGVAEILNKPTIPSLTGYVPYTGATTDLDLGTYNLTADHINLNVSPSGAGFVVGSTQWNNDLGSSQTLLKGGSVTLKNGVDLVARVVNKVVPNTTLTKAAYQVVRVAGAQGQRLAVDLAQADTDLNSADTLGVVTETITTNQEGFILTVGQLLDVNTTGSLQGETWNDGDVLYLSPTVAGKMTNIKPNGSTGHIVVLGYVEYAHANHGKIYVKIMNGWELDELHNVFISTPLNNQVLSYASATDLWVNRNVSEFNDLQVRRNGFILFDDLLTIANGTSPFIKGALSSGQILATGNTQNNPGVITINCSATANSGAYVTYVNSATATSSFLSNNMGFDAIVSLGPAPTAATTIRAGLIRGTMTSADATEGCYFEIINTGIVGKTAMGGVRSSTASFTLAANTFYHLRIIYNSTTLNTFQVYNMSGSLLFSATLNTNISTGASAIQPTFLATSNNGATSTIALLDYIAIEYPSYNRGALT